MLLGALLFLFHQHSTTAAPFSFEPSGYNATLFIRDGSADDPSDACSARSVWDIVWSCLATTFAVTWVSVHPNLPFLEEGSWSMLKRRIFLMCLALLAPEAMIIWAFKQWRGAVMIKEAFNKARPTSCRPWTMSHAHFLQMGGFKLRGMRRVLGCKYQATIYMRNNRSSNRVEYEGVLKFVDLEHLLTGGMINFPDVREEEIKDRSKSDALSKGVALLQISWFIIQLIARANQHLAITEIELTTAALAGLNSIMYLFWWNKPFDVRCPIVIRTKELERCLAETGNIKGASDDGEQTEGSSLEPEGWGEWTFPDPEEFKLKSYLMMTARKWLSRVILYIRPANATYRMVCECPFQGPCPDPTQVLRPIAEKPTKRRFLDLPWTCCKSAVTKVLYLPHLLMFLPIDQIFSPHGTPNLTSFKDVKDKMDKVPSLQLLFNDGDMKWIMSMMFYSERADTKPLLIFSALAGAAFGSIHCAAWNSDFPSTAEHILWRTASLTIVVICLCIIAGRPLHNYAHAMWENAFFTEQQFSSLAMRTFETIPAVIYSVARLCLLILSLISLRKLPDSALETVTWTDFIPHI